MESVLSLAGIALLAFAATNLDNLLLLVGLLSREGQGFGASFTGVLLWLGVLLALCLAGAWAADLVPIAWLGYLGVIPIALGLREFYRLARARRPDAEPQAAGGPPLPAAGVAGVMLANSADSLGALLPVFAETRTALLPVIALTVLLAGVGGWAVARRMATSPALGPALQRVAPYVVPFALIAVGLYVLSDTATDTLG